MQLLIGWLLSSEGHTAKNKPYMQHKLNLLGELKGTGWMREESGGEEYDQETLYQVL